MARFASLKKLQNQLASDNTVVLLVCIFIAGIFWLFIALSNSHSDEIKLQVRYINKPPDKVVVNELPEEMAISVTGQGWELLGHHLNLNRDEEIVIDVARFGATGEFLPNNYFPYFEGQLPSSFSIEEITPKNIHFNFDERGTLRVPVRLIADIELNPLFGLADSISITPDSVTISGPKQLVERYNYVPTDTIRIEDVKQNLSLDLPLQLPPVSTITYGRSSVQLNVEVEPFTEKKVEVPVQIINEPDQPVVLLANETTVSFRLPLKVLENTSEEELATLFEVIADFSNVKEGDTKVKLELVSQPSFAQGATISPRQIEFLYRR